MIREIAALLLLLPTVIFDVKKQRVPILYLIGMGIVGTAVSLISGEVPWWSVLSGIAVGGLLLLLSKATKEAIGYGDGAMTAALGAWFGLQETVSALFLGLFAAGIAAGICLILKKGRRYRLPFAPFLLIGGIAAVVLEFIGGGGQ